MTLQFNNQELYNLITKDQLNGPSVVVLVVTDETDIPAVVEWVPTVILTGNTPVYSAASRITKAAVGAIIEKMNNPSSPYKPDLLIMYGALIDEVRVKELHTLSRATGKPVVLVSTQDSILKRTQADDGVRQLTPEMFLSTCATQVLVGNGKVSSLRGLRNIATPSGYEVIL